MTTFSVIVRCRNHGHFVHGAIKSVLHQTQDDVDLIVVAYGSTDGMLEIVTQYLQARLVQCFDSRTGIARNTGIQAVEAMSS